MPSKHYIILLLLCITSQVFAQGKLLDRRVDLTFEKLTIERVILLIEQKSYISFAYSQLPELQHKISGTYKSKSLRYILDHVLKEEGLSYKYLSGNIVVYKPKQSSKMWQKSTHEERYIVSGYVVDSSTGEMLIGAAIIDQGSSVGTTTNHAGYYSIQLASGTHKLTISYLGYQNKIIQVTQWTQLNVQLQMMANELGQITVTSKAGGAASSITQSGNIHLHYKDMRYIPSTIGESDVMKSITLLPGLISGSDGEAGLYVRGGSPDQNLILLDDVPLYSPYHFWGVLSIFNTDAINNVDLIKGGFPAKYGGKLSSILDITMKEGSTQDWSADASIGILSAKISANGPVVKGKSSIMIAVRRTYLDLLLTPLLNRIGSEDGLTFDQNYNFSDIHMKWNYKHSNRDRVFISGMYSRDHAFFSTIYTQEDAGQKFEEKTIFQNQWDNRIASIRWNHLYRSNIFSNTTGYYTSYNYLDRVGFSTQFQLDQKTVEENESNEFESRIMDVGLKQNNQYFINNNHNLRFGGSMVRHLFRPKISLDYQPSDRDTSYSARSVSDLDSWEGAMYLEEEFYPNHWLKINAGVNASFFLVGTTKYRFLEPRISMSYFINPRIDATIGYTHMRQFIHLLSNTSLVSSADLWVPSTDKLKPESAQQVSIQLQWRPHSHYTFSIDAYYKTMRNLLNFNTGISYLLARRNWEENTDAGLGKSYGFEFFAQKHAGRFTGWLSYALSKSTRYFPSLNHQKAFPFRNDRRHVLSIVSHYKISNNWGVNATWIIQSGRAVTLPLIAHTTPGYDGRDHIWNHFPELNTPSSSGIVDNGILEINNTPNNYRLPNYQRLDLSFNYTIKKKQLGYSLNIGVTNLYNHFNASSYSVIHEPDPNTGEISTKYIAQMLFPIFPAINYKISF